MYALFFSNQPRKFLKNLEKETRHRIYEKIEGLAQNPFPQEVVRVAGKKEKVFRVRVGRYRIQYVVMQEAKQILITDIDKRDRAYN